MFFYLSRASLIDIKILGIVTLTIVVNCGECKSEKVKLRSILK